MVAQGVFATGILSSYCTVADVLKVLRAYDLSAFGSTEELEARLRELLPISKQMADSIAGRDFDWHEGEELLFDGNGTARLQLFEAAVASPVLVTALEVNGRSVAAEHYRTYAETGLVRLLADSPVPRFSEGVQNVRVTVTWGYEHTPADVATAQAKLTAAEVLAELSGPARAVQETRIGDYSVKYSAEGSSGGAGRELYQEAERTLARYRPLRVAVV